MKGKKIDNDTVRHVARLSRLTLSENEVGKFSSELSAILEYIDKLSELNTDNIEPTSHVVSNVKNVFREDRIIKSLSSEEALKNTPKRIQDFFGVPKIIE